MESAQLLVNVLMRGTVASRTGEANGGERTMTDIIDGGMKIAIEAMRVGAILLHSRNAQETTSHCLLAGGMMRGPEGRSQRGTSNTVPTATGAYERPAEVLLTYSTSDK